MSPGTSLVNNQREEGEEEQGKQGEKNWLWRETPPGSRRQNEKGLDPTPDAGTVSSVFQLAVLVCVLQPQKCMIGVRTKCGQERVLVTIPGTQQKERTDSRSCPLSSTCAHAPPHKLNVQVLKMCLLGTSLAKEKAVLENVPTGSKKDLEPKIVEMYKQRTSKYQGSLGGTERTQS